MDFNALQRKLFELDPSDPAEDLRKLTESANSNSADVAPTVDYVDQSAEITEGSLPVEGDYSIADFAALAGVTLTEAQKKGPAGQAKGRDPMPKAEPGRIKHPLKDKLVGEADSEGNVWDTMKSAYNKGKRDYNKLGALDPFDKVGSAKAAIDKKLSANPSSKASSAAKPNPSKAPHMTAKNWKEFLKQHTAGLQSISRDPKKKAEFDKFMARIIESSNQHTADVDMSTESIKEMLYRKLNDKK